MEHLLKIPCTAMPFVSEADYSVTLAPMIHADRTAPFHVAIYLLQGSMEIIEDGIPYRIMPDQIFFLKSGIHHWGNRSFEIGSSWYYAHFYCDAPSSCMEELPRGIYYDERVSLKPSEKDRYFITLPKLINCEEKTQIKRNFEKMIEAHIHGNIPQASIRLWQIFLECAQNAQDDKVSNGYAEQIQNYVRQHYIDGFTSAQIQEACGLSYKYAGTLFKEVTGQTIKEYQCTLRLRKAEQLLKETNKSITEIAQLTGFSDVFYFSKIFHRKKGCPPGEYRKTYIPGI
ncbi:helix-turn-helix transcriptional regulator [Suilimivivens aceti]|uniref:Helix-turn-helix transcriptional regulator n=1 Tax=Suilimivivens aceti TaxID=2981774 RepID=A0ABT2T1W1_9FIRM|nr:AraC family transcriptional regulator [Suilimivivens aceti]MCU6744200.1 helix-turn-helix transcriptional regulator [Suilimivivens aceti]SCH62323.1 Bacillibactin transport regulator [uncultured Clostridium sp.]